MPNTKVCTISGRDISELTIDRVLSGELQNEDFRISADTLSCQADAAESAGYRQLAQNLRRAAELTRLSNEEVIQIYEKLRPGRTTFRELTEIADRLETQYHAPMTAAFVREAAGVYLERGLVK